MKKFWNIFKKVMLVLSVTAFAVLFVFTLTSAVRQQKKLVCSSIQVKIDYESGLSFLTTDEMTNRMNSLSDGNIVGKPLSQLDAKRYRVRPAKEPVCRQSKGICRPRSGHAC
jgi:hypothetical protein